MPIANEDGYGALLDAVEAATVFHDTLTITDQIWDCLEDNGYVVVKSNTKKLLPADVRQIRAMHRRGASQADIAHAYRVNPATVSRIVRGIYH